MAEWVLLCCVQAGVSRPHTHLYSQNPRGAQRGGGLCGGAFPGAILHSRLYGQELLVSRDGPHPVLPCSLFVVLCRALGRPASSWLAVVLQSRFCVEDSIGGVSPHSPSRWGGLLFSTPVFPQIMRVRVPDSEEGLRAALWKGGREGGSKLIPIWLS